MVAVCMAVIGIVFPFTQVSPESMIIYFDDFEGSTFKWAQSYYGICSLSDFSSFSGDQCMNITAYPYCNQEALRMVGTPEGDLSRFTLDFEFAMPYTSFNYFCFGLEISSIHRDKAYYASILLPHGQYLDENDTFTDLPGLNYLGWDLSDNYEIWHKAQLIVDFETGKYVSVTVDDQTLDLTSMNLVPHEKPRYFWGIVYAWFYVGAYAQSCACLVDDVSVTLGSET